MINTLGLGFGVLVAAAVALGTWLHSRDRAQMRAVWPALAAREADPPRFEPMQITLDAEGNVVEVVTLRWSDANPEKVFRLQPFGGRMLEWGSFDGFTIPARVELGNLFGTADYAPFFQASVKAARF